MRVFHSVILQSPNERAGGVRNDRFKGLYDRPLLVNVYDTKFSWEPQEVQRMHRLQGFCLGSQGFLYLGLRLKRLRMTAYDLCQREAHLEGTYCSSAPEWHL